MKQLAGARDTPATCHVAYTKWVVRNAAGIEMQVNVAQLLKERPGATRLMELDGPALELADAASAVVRGELALTRTDRGIWASGALAISVEGVCSRCLVPFTYWVEVRVDDEFLPSVDPVTGAELRHAAEADADIHSIDAQHVLDLTDAMRQYRQAALPLAPVCREECRGICPECGTDLNETTCGCEPSLDPRWDKLRELLR